MAPEAPKVVVAPGQILVLIPASTTGKGLTVIVTLSVAEQPLASVPTTV